MTIDLGIVILIALIAKMFQDDQPSGHRSRRIPPKRKRKSIPKR